jgi:hypothetical protein
MADRTPAGGPNAHPGTPGGPAAPMTPSRERPRPAPSGWFSSDATTATLVAFLVGFIGIAAIKLSNQRLVVVVILSILFGVVIGLAVWWVGRKKNGWSTQFAVNTGLGMSDVVCLIVFVTALLLPSGSRQPPMSTPTATSIVQLSARDPSSGNYTVPFNTPTMTLLTKVLPSGISVSVGPAATTQGSPHALVVTVPPLSGCPYDDITPHITPTEQDDLYAWVGVTGYTYFVSVAKVTSTGVQLFGGRFGPGPPLFLGCGHSYGTSPAGALEALLHQLP